MGTKDKARWQLGGILCGISFTGIGPEGSQAQGTASEDQFVTFLLDTHGVSEWVKPRPNPGLIGWTESTDEDRVFISVITLAELRYGVERMAAGKRQNRLEAWLRHELPVRFEGRILPIDSNIAETWGKMVSSSEAAGRPMGAMDAFPAATAENHRLTLVTRNISDFPLLKAVLNPWT
jgi:predicted nucleic acid-binding protein